MNLEGYADKRVFITGHTGFKGAWLTQWLVTLGAEVMGYSLEPPTVPALWSQLGLESKIRSCHGDIRDLNSLRSELANFQPDFVFHLAAQSLVIQSYEDPLTTYSTNAIGTVNVLEALRLLERPCIAIMVTTDKVYENLERDYGYREEDSLGGHDPYSASKAMAEIAVSSYRRSWFTVSPNKGMPIRVASVRAGNVIGGGDWAANRIVPDCIRSLSEGKSIGIRNPESCRPWQHVLDPLCGYLMLAECIRSASDPKQLEQYCSAFNFGPESGDNRTVLELVRELLKVWPGSYELHQNPASHHESKLLRLSPEKAKKLVRWRGTWDFSDAVKKTVEWYYRVDQGDSPEAVTLEQLRQFKMDCRS